VSQSGSALTLNTGRETFTINAGGFDIPEHPNQEQLC
jgi:hypothetical protein